MQQSELALFAQDFRRALAPLEAALRLARERLGGGGGPLPSGAEELEAGLAALAGELAALVERVTHERATVFVFGPAKAGKSTLLDALGGARLSEVSILPGYPCLLRARHAEEESAQLLRFDGTLEAVPDPDALRLLLQRSHGELVTRVREVRAAGEAFDPARHHQGAVRRVERARPAGPLASGALELVECPPIHGPLFPSYAEMMIGEPDHARAAVFVVRAAQLCDDAVFDGIEELLAAFERLILVVNLDERGRELSRAGELAASPEREDPARLVAAFEEFSTCDALVRAVRAGRVPVLALDLLEAARTRLHGAEEGPAVSPRQRTRYVDLARELAQGLDRHEAFLALGASALRRAGELLEEGREQAGTPLLAELVRSREALERELAAQLRVRAALEQLGARERARWEVEELFEGLRAALVSRGLARARELADELQPRLARALEDWFADGSSLQALLEQAFEPRLASARTELARSAERALREELEPAAVTRLSEAVRNELAAARFDLGALLARSAARLRLSLPPAPLRALDLSAIPVRPRLGQRLTWRGAADVRRALFGPPEAPDAPISSADKARRLGDEARAAMGASVAERVRAMLEEEAHRLARALDEALLATFAEDLRAAVERELARLAEPTRVLAARLESLGASHDALAALAPACARAQGGLADLAERLGPSGVLVPTARAARETERRREPEPALERDPH